MTGLRKHWPALTYLLIASLAALLRFGGLTQLPHALWVDEAWFGLKGQEIVHGADLVPLSGWSEGVGVGNSLFQMYAAAAAQAFGAPLAYSSRVASAVLGWLTVVALYPALLALWSKVLPIGQKQIAALVGAASLASLFVGIHSGRGGVQPAGCAFWTVITLTSLYCTFARRSWRWAIATGITLAVSLTTYEAAYSLPFIVALYAVLRIAWPDDDARQKNFLLGALLGGVALVAFSPLIVFYLCHPGTLWPHLSQTEALSGAGPVSALARLAIGLWNTWGGISVRGDALPGRNLVNRPMFDVFLSALLWTGVAWSLLTRRYRFPSIQLALLWIVVMSLPPAATQEAPAFTRMLPMVPGLCAFVGLGAAVIWQRVNRPRFTAALLALGLVTSSLFSVRDYFTRWVYDPRTFDATYAGARLTADLALALTRSDDVFITSRTQPLLKPPLEALLTGTPVQTFDATSTCLPYVNRSPRPVTYGVIPLFDPNSLSALKAAYPSGEEVGIVAHPDGYAYSIFFRIPAGTSAPSPAHVVNGAFENGLRLSGFDVATVAHPGDTVTLKLYWETNQPLTHALTDFVHIGRGAKSDPLIAQLDAPICPGFDTSRWSSGYTYIETRPLPLAPDAPPDTYDIRVGVYLPSANYRLTILAADVPTENNRVVLTTLEVH